MKTRVTRFPRRIVFAVSEEHGKRLEREARTAKMTLSEYIRVRLKESP